MDWTRSSVNDLQDFLLQSSAFFDVMTPEDFVALSSSQ
jgi:hypothetical protein